MKKVKLISVVALAGLLTAGMFFSCKKDEAEDPDLTFIKDFYGVNVVHSFVCPNPTNDQKSLRVDLVWDDKGVATYTTTDIAKDSSEHNGWLFLPTTDYDAATGTITSERKVKVVTLIFSNGNITPAEDLFCTSGYWVCSSTSICTSVGPYPYLVTTLNGSFLTCGIPYDNGSSVYWCPPYWHCTSLGIDEVVLIGWESE